MILFSFFDGLFGFDVVDNEDRGGGGGDDAGAAAAAATGVLVVVMQAVRMLVLMFLILMYNLTDVAGLVPLQWLLVFSEVGRCETPCIMVALHFA